MSKRYLLTFVADIDTEVFSSPINVRSSNTPPPGLVERIFKSEWNEVDFELGSWVAVGLDNCSNVLGAISGLIKNQGMLSVVL